KNDRRFHLFRRGDANHMPPWWPAGGIEFARQLAGGFSETAARGSGNVPLFQQSFLRHGSRSMMPFASNSVTTFGPDPLGDAPLRAELFGLERLEAHAHTLAQSAKARTEPGVSLLRWFEQQSEAFLRTYEAIKTAYRTEKSFGADAEWLLDNVRIIQDALREVGTDLPRGYYKLLPKLIDGPWRGYPRIFALALDLIRHCDSSLDETIITRFLQAYQTVTPLTIGELWGVPIMLRLGLVDNLRRLARQILAAHETRLQARAWVARNVVAGAAVLPAALRPTEALSESFVVHLLEELRGHPLDHSWSDAWLDACLADRGVTAVEVVRCAAQQQAANQVSIGNCVTTL